MLAALSVATANIQAGAVGATQIANAAITTAKIGAAQITTALIANGAITNALIGTAAVGTANIQNAAVTSAIIANLAVGNAHINDVSAGKITAGTISASISITSPTIISTSGSTSVTLASGAVTCVLGAKSAVLGNAVLTVTDASFGKACTMSEAGTTGNDGGSHSYIIGLAGIAYVNGSKSFSVDLAGGSSNLALSGYAVTFGGVTILNSSGDLARAKFTGIPQFAGTNSTAGGSASLGSNCPAGTDLSKPYTWIEVQAADGTLGWVPMWN
jgi:hypothetical protein